MKQNSLPPDEADIGHCIDGRFDCAAPEMGQKRPWANIGRMSGSPESTGQAPLVDHLAGVERDARAGMVRAERSLVTGNMPRR
jgi:hypothetical protein